MLCKQLEIHISLEVWGVVQAGHAKLGIINHQSIYLALKMCD